MVIIQYDADVRFAHRRGATPCSWVQERFPKATLRQFDDQCQTLQGVLNGHAHAMISSQPLPAFTVYDSLDTVSSPSDEKIAPGNEEFAVRKGDPDALNFFNLTGCRFETWIIVAAMVFVLCYGLAWMFARHERRAQRAYHC